MSAGYVTEQGTGDCGLVAANLALDGDGGLVLCHGYPTYTGPEYAGMKFWHAWVETADGEHVLDFSNGNQAVLPRVAYYLFGQIDEEEVQRYSCDEAREMTLTFGHYGPWNDPAHPPVR
jgi:hypothetical protein